MIFSISLLYYNKDNKMSKKIVTVIEEPDGYRELELTYDTYCKIYDLYMKAYSEKDMDLFLSLGQKLYDLALNLISIINENKEKFEPIKEFPLFQNICKLLYDFKNKIEDNYTILHFRKCINWIKRKY